MSQVIHFISIGGSAMHNLALTLHQQGYTISGSDDEIYDPSRTRLLQHGLLPPKTGWFPEKITTDLNAVIVGMHASKDNPELVKAQELGLPIYSYPEFMYLQSQHKQRVVIAGSHGKTTITAMILHVLKYHNRKFDFLAGEQIDGFETMAQLTPDAPVIILEGDEYPSSPIDSRPKFLHYQPHIALISGIAWDHVNIYPTWDEYVDAFESLAEAMPKAGILIFDESDDMLDIIGQKDRTDITKIPYLPHPATTVEGKTILLTKKGAKVPVQVFGQYNLKNISGAMTVCDRIGITEEQFYEAIPTFRNVSMRLEKVAESSQRILFRDFAHSPVKVEATTEAVKHQYPNWKLVAVVELSTFSSLNKAFLEQYRGTLDMADQGIVYISKNASDVNSEAITADYVLAAFGKPGLLVFNKADDLLAHLIQQRDVASVFLLMSSGNFDGLDLNMLADQLI
ncbi:UDP-N-acetylmuramate--L-alanine ligase [Spirosoma pollinicola]|uniref:Peptidoglycan synthetase n=1 Tax=Spirosoma pollinicola TaxID=2057025 RepID=A0A2K8ZA12_9BACT|nr:Mur ligase family protein [Spirosoma pollinicola]AUD06713.1 peptidoglycan synthetase [Spirosoma pollinicola]